MKKPNKPKILLRIASGFLASFAYVFAFIWHQRRKLDYNEAGQYFDATAGVTYSEQAVAVYGGGACLFLLLAMIGLLAGRYI